MALETGAWSGAPAAHFPQTETKPYLRNAAVPRGLSGIHMLARGDRTGWLGREDSNLRMAESKSAALPLGYAPSGGLLRRGGARTIATAIRPING